MALDRAKLPAVPGAIDPDLDLLESHRAGDRGAFDELVRRHRDSIARVVGRYVKNPDDAADVTQRVFVSAFTKLASFRGDASFRTWLHRIAVNLALNHVRGRPDDDAVPLDDVATFTHALETSKLVTAELWQKVSARLESLAPKQRLVVELRVFHDLSFAEIAILADCSEDSAKQNYHHAVRRLRSLLPPLARE